MSTFKERLLSISSDLSNDLDMEEFMNFSVKGEALNIHAQLAREITRLDFNLSNLCGETFDLKKRNAFREMLNNLIDLYNSGNFNPAALKLLITHLNIEFDMDPLFSTSIAHLKNNIDRIKSFDDDSNMTFNSLYENYTSIVMKDNIPYTLRIRGKK